MPEARLELLTRDGCHLCVTAAETLARIGAEAGVIPREIDVDADPELQAEYEQLRAAGKQFSSFAGERSFAGRDVVYYREHLPGAIAEWYVLHEGRFRVSVGCQYTEDTKAAVQRACEQVVSSLQVR